MNEVLCNFKSVPKGYGEVPFFWWLGDKLTKEKLSWQLEQLKDHHISGIQVNYAHSDTGGRSFGLTLESDPPLFSKEWWEIFGWFMKETKKYGISLSLSDYTLGIPGQGWYMDEVIDKNPDIIGSKLMSEGYTVNKAIKQTIPQNTISLIAYELDTENNDTYKVISHINLTNKISDNIIDEYIGEGTYKVIAVYVKQVEYSVDPMNKRLGPEVIKAFFGRFTDMFPNEGGDGLNFFFSDELCFNISGNLWNNEFANEFIKQKGYDITPYLPAIFEDIGDITPKIRLDYYDVIVRLTEEAYFKPVYEWHEAQGMTFGCDHGGRGTDVCEFGDYFRTQRWNQGPGNDQPLLASDIIKNKVSCSIAHMYKRPRTWLEGFYSSGWGTSSGDVADAIYRNFAMGQNLLSLHGLYYSTYGSMWEWAPPCNHYHMPYWEHMKVLLGASERLSYLMSQGVHRCDVAIIYPVAAVEGGIDGDKSVKTAFKVAEHLYPRGIDFDFIDFESVERARISNGRLCVSDEEFKYLIIPSMKTIRFSTLLKAKELANNGGTVIFIGDLPIASDHAGKNDKALESLVSDILINAVTVNTEQEVEDIINGGVRDFRCDCNKEIKQFIQHRKIENYDVYMVYGIPKGEKCFFKTKGQAQLWDAFTGSTKVIYAEATTEGTVVELPLDQREAHLIIFDNTKILNEGLSNEQADKINIIKADGEWECELKPTLNNKYGDYRLPAFDGYLGAEVRQFKFKQTNEDCSNKEFNDSDWEELTYSYGTYFWKLGPLNKAPDESELIFLTSVDKTTKIIADESEHYFTPYNFSMRMGVEGDAGDQGSYHGLKGKVTDDFIALGEKVLTKASSSSIYEKEDKGDIYYLFTTVYCEEATTAKIKSGEKIPDCIWLNHKRIDNIDEMISLNRGYNYILLKYNQAGRTHFVLEKANKQEFNQAIPLSMNWYNNPNIIPFDASPKDNNKTGWLRFTTPPGMLSMSVKAYGELDAFVNGEGLKKQQKRLENGITEYTFACNKKYPRSEQAAIKIKQARGKYNAAAIDEVIAFDCETGIIKTGDWSSIDALKCYSGGLWYRKSINISNLNGKFVLDMGKVVASAEVYVNGKPAGIKVAPPFTLDITEYVVLGENRLEILVYSTLGNHYITIPSNYKGGYAAGLDVE